MRPFNSKEYEDNPSLEVITKDGKAVRILCTNRKNENKQCVIALVTMEYGDDWVMAYDENGKILYSTDDNPNNLYFINERKEGWVNIYPNYKVFASKEDAINNAEFPESRIDTIKIKWYE